MSSPSLVPDPVRRPPFYSPPPRVWKRLGPKPLHRGRSRSDKTADHRHINQVIYTRSCVMLRYRWQFETVLVILRRPFSWRFRAYRLGTPVSETDRRRLYWRFSAAKMFSFACQPDTQDRDHRRPPRGL